MAVDVRLPTLLRANTDGASSVAADGATVGEVFGSLTDRYPGLKGQLVDDQGDLHKFVNVYVNDDDIRYLDQPRHQGDRRRRHLDPARGGGRLSRRGSAAVVRHENILGVIGDTPLVGVHALSPNPDVRIFAKLEGQNPGGSSKDRIALKMIELAEAAGELRAGRHHPRAVVGQHRHRARARGPAARLPAARRDARERVDRTAPAARDLRRRDRAVAGRRGQQRRHPACRRSSAPTTRRSCACSSTATRPTRSRTTSAPVPRSGATAPRSTCSSPGSAPAAR